MSLESQILTFNIYGLDICMSSVLKLRYILYRIYIFHGSILIKKIFKLSIVRRSKISSMLLATSPTSYALVSTVNIEIFVCLIEYNCSHFNAWIKITLLNINFIILMCNFVST